MSSEATGIDPKKYGVSFSPKQCWGIGIDPSETLAWLLKEGWQRFRLMSYWDEIEKVQGTYDFSLLDWQLKQIAETDAVVTLCLGARQPRWPENHWPEWAWAAPHRERTNALLTFIQAIVERYKSCSVIVSYQLENEALLKNFGLRAEVDRQRLRQEYDMVKKLDPTKPVIMTTSTSWGIPIRRPRPNVVGFSFYQVLYSVERKVYTTAFHKPWLDKLRATAILILWKSSSFIHELQCEPWGPKGIQDMTIAEQNQSMSDTQIRRNIKLAQNTGLYPIDLWGGEWWCLRHTQDKAVLGSTSFKQLLQ